MFQSLYQFLQTSKLYYDQKINCIFSSNFETMFTKHSPLETFSLSLEKKALYFKWNVRHYQLQNSEIAR